MIKLISIVESNKISNDNTLSMIKDFFDLYNEPIIFDKLSNETELMDSNANSLYIGYYSDGSSFPINSIKLPTAKNRTFDVLRDTITKSLLNTKSKSTEYIKIYNDLNDVLGLGGVPTTYGIGFQNFTNQGQVKAKSAQGILNNLIGTNTSKIVYSDANFVCKLQISKSADVTKNIKDIINKHI